MSNYIKLAKEIRKRVYKAYNIKPVTSEHFDSSTLRANSAVAMLYSVEVFIEFESRRNKSIFERLPGIKMLRYAAFRKKLATIEYLDNTNLERLVFLLLEDLNLKDYPSEVLNALERKEYPLSRLGVDWSQEIDWTPGEGQWILAGLSHPSDYE